MKRQRRRDTEPELALRRAMHRLGLRFFIHRQPIPGLRREADVVFPRARLAVFLDSCFWHGCPQHGTWPKANAGWWRAKIEGNVARDRETDASFNSAGWLVVRVWEHENADEAAARVRRELADRLSRSPRGI